VKKSTEKVSIVLPTYNGSRYLRQAIDSCMKQTYQNIELIIVDDGSTDKTPEIIQSYKDKRIKYIKHEKNRGLPDTLNTGFNHATGAYLTWTSDDNIYTENAIEKMLAFLKEKKLKFVYCDYYSFENDDLQNRRIIKLPDNFIRAGLCFLYSRKVKDVVGDYNPEFILAEDYDYFVRVSFKFPMGHLGEPLLYVRRHPASLSSTRYYDVMIIVALVRLTHALIDVDHAVDDLVVGFAGKYWGHQRINTILVNHIFSRKDNMALWILKKLVAGIYLVYYIPTKLITGILLSRRIKKVLKDFMAKNLSLAEAKLALKTLLIGK
jgi:glycosyltransferase involved in cell wall biosynthesis